MADVSTGTRVGASDWGSDFFGTLNEMPPDPVTGIGQILESMHTLPAFHDGRDWVLRNLGLSRGSSVMEAGCGTGASLPDILAVVGPAGRIVGIDPTFAFVDSARSRAARLGIRGYLQLNLQARRVRLFCERQSCAPFPFG